MILKHLFLSWLALRGLEQTDERKRKTEEGAFLNEFKVSIIVPVYNVEKYLDKCLSSLSEQSYTNIEVLTVNDGSSDGSKDICLRYKEKDDRFILLDKENGGLSSARNLGLNKATGEFVCFVDSDDWVYPDFVKCLVDSIGEADVIISKYRLDDGNRIYIPFEKEVIETEFRSNNIEIIVEKLIRDNMSGKNRLKGTVMPVWKNMYRKSFLDKYDIKFISERKVYFEDYLFNLLAYINAKDIRMTSSAQIVHVIQNNSLSQSYRKGMFEMQKCCYYSAISILQKCSNDYLKIKAEEKALEVVCYSIFKECLCGWKEAENNASRILKDEFTQTALKTQKFSGLKFKNRVLLKMVHIGCPALIVFTVKVMIHLEKPYRFFQYLYRNR